MEIFDSPAGNRSKSAFSKSSENVNEGQGSNLRNSK